MGIIKDWVQLSALPLLTSPPYPLAYYCGKSFVLCFWFCFFSVLQFLWPSYLFQRSLCRQIWSHRATWLLVPSPTAAAASWTSATSSLSCTAKPACSTGTLTFFFTTAALLWSQPWSQFKVRVIFKLFLQLGSSVTFN